MKLSVSSCFKQARALTSGQFVRNVATLAAGTAAAQAIAMVFSPIITRLYGPEAFGLLAIFTSVVGLLSAGVALSYSLILLVLFWA